METSHTPGSAVRAPRAAGPRGGRRARLGAGVLALALPLAGGALVGPPAAAADPSAQVYRVRQTVPVGSSPSGVAVDPSGTAYVANNSDDTVSVLRGGAVTGTIRVGGGPFGVAVDPSSSTAYVTDYNDGTLSLVRGGAVIGTIRVGDNPGAVAIDGTTGTAYVSNFFDGSVSVVQHGAVTRTIDVGGFPPRVAVDPNTGTAYVTNGSSDTVSVIRGGAVTRTIRVGAFAYGVAVDPRSSTVYVTNETDGTVSVIRGGAVTGTIKVGRSPDGVAVDPANGTAYVTNYAGGTVSVIQGGAVVATVAVGSGPQDVAVGPEGAAYVTNQNDGTVSVITSAPAGAPTITGSPDSPATVGDHYSYAYRVTGSPAPTVRVTAGALPAGLALSTAGVLSGTPTTAGTYTFTLAAHNATGSDASITSTVVVDPVSPPWQASVRGYTSPTVGSASGISLGVRGETWTLQATQPSRTKTLYSGTIYLDHGDFSGVTGLSLEPSDGVSVNGDTLFFHFADYGSVDGIRFTTPNVAGTITFALDVAESPAVAGQVFTGLHHRPTSTGSPLTFRRTSGP